MKQIDNADIIARVFSDKIFDGVLASFTTWNSLSRDAANRARLKYEHLDCLCMWYMASIKYHYSIDELLVIRHYGKLYWHIDTFEDGTESPLLVYNPLSLEELID